MECHLVRLLLSVTAARELDSAHATSPATLIDLAQRATENKKKSTCRRLRRCETSLDVEGRSLMRKWRRRLRTFSVFSRCDNCLLALPYISNNATCNDRLLSVTHWAAGGCAQTSWDTSKMDIVTAVGFWKAETFIRSHFVRSPSDSRACSPMGWNKCGRQDLHPSRWVSPWVFNLLAF